MNEEFDYCEECGIYGDDYYIDEDGGLTCRCDECPLNLLYNEDDD